jgi:hypothetical protein
MQWWSLSNPWSLRSWLTQASWADPISLAGRAKAPFVVAERMWYYLLAPVGWFGLGLGVLVIAGVLRRRERGDLRQLASDRRGWLWLALLFLAGGVVSPDTVGLGSYLPQRVILLGLAALAPYLELDLGPHARRLAGATVALALVLQSAFLWDYALLSNRLVGAYMQAKPAVGRGRRVGTLLAHCHFSPPPRANPLLHIGSMMGVDTGSIVWDNYEPLYPVFPVQFRDEAAYELTHEFVPLSCYDGGTNNLAECLDHWTRMIDRHHNEIDVLVVRGSRPELDATIDPWFQPIFQQGEIRVLENRSQRPFK